MHLSWHQSAHWSRRVKVKSSLKVQLEEMSAPVDLFSRKNGNNLYVKTLCNINFVFPFVWENMFDSSLVFCLCQEHGLRIRMTYCRAERGQSWAWSLICNIEKLTVFLSQIFSWPCLYFSSATLCFNQRLFRHMCNNKMEIVQSNLHDCLNIITWPDWLRGYSAPV